MLEIKVNEVVHVSDDALEAIVYISRVINEWYMKDDQTPLNLTITKLDNKAPPLEISVGDVMNVKTILR